MESWASKEQGEKAGDLQHGDSPEDSLVEKGSFQFLLLFYSKLQALLSFGKRAAISW
jgi:hypothetical protein